MWMGDQTNTATDGRTDRQRQADKHPYTNKQADEADEQARQPGKLCHTLELWHISWCTLARVEYTVQV